MQTEGDGLRSELLKQGGASTSAKSHLPVAKGCCGGDVARNCVAPRTGADTYNEVKAGVREMVKERGMQQLVNRDRRICSKLAAGLITVLGGAMLLSAFVSEQAGTAEIVDSGSTNTAGFRILVDRAGRAEYKAVPRKNGPQTDANSGNKRRQLSRELADRFYADLEAAKPFSSLPDQHCMKSASFGTTRSIEFAGEKTPDLSCGDGGDPKLQAIIRDANEIVKLFSTSEDVPAPRKPQ
jgi:hypothetical protein